MAERFPIQLGAFAPALRLIKVKRDTAYVELGEASLEIVYGYVGAVIPYGNITSVEVKKWPSIAGIGLRIAKHKTMGYIGRLGDAVWLGLSEPMDLKAGPGSMSMIRHNVALTMNDDEAFASAVRSRLSQ